jgi:mannose-1-phosphate guanylyltransferase
MFMSQHNEIHSTVLWGLVLAAGDGTRLQRYIERLKGERLPKQFVNFIGQRSMLEHTYQRAEKLIPPEKILTIVGRHHLQHVEVRRQLSSRDKNTVIVQPANKETGPGILLPLIHLYKRCPEAIVSVFPSDHFILEEDRFMAHVDLAAQAVARNPSRMVLLAMEAQAPEVEYGYVVPWEGGGEIDLHGARRVARFVEKPHKHMAQELFESGALWNTMIMVFKVKTLLQMIQDISPDMHCQFIRILDAIGTEDEQRTIDEVYRTLEPINFSKGFLEKISEVYPETISVLPVLQIYWSDWGSPQRLLESQQLLGLCPPRSDAAQSRAARDERAATRISGRTLAW